MYQRKKLIEILQNAPRKYMGQDDLADYLIANGVIVPPCKVGDTVWFVDLEWNEEVEYELPFITEGKVESFSMQTDGLWACCRYKSGLTFWHLVEKDFGQDVFLSHEEAETALKGGEG